MPGNKVKTGTVGSSCSGFDFRFYVENPAYRMSRKELENPHFRSCLRPLTQHDRIRLKSLQQQESYRELVTYMLEQNVKLEQEIVSFYGMEKGSEGERIADDIVLKNKNGQSAGNLQTRKEN